KYMETIPKTQTVNDIRQLTMALETFKTKYGLYPPSRIILGPNMDSASQTYLNAIWPRINWSAVNWTQWAGYQDATTTPRNIGAGLLGGDQCLVYFLNGPWGTGWSVNPNNPADPTGPRVGPFFEFPHNTIGSASNRLVIVNRGANTNDFESFLDPYGTSTP